MKKIIIALAAAVIAVFSTTSCQTIVKATPTVEYGWDIDKDGNLSFDNMNMALILNAEMCAALDKALLQKGFKPFNRYFVGDTPMTVSETKAILKDVIHVANLDSYTVNGYDFDFVIRFQMAYEGPYYEVFRKNLYKK